MLHLRILAVCAALSFTCGGAQAETYRMTLSGASPGGIWSIVGAGVIRAIKEAYPGSDITYQTSGGGFANIGLLDAGKVELGIAHNVELKLALEGAKPFSRPITTMRAVATLYDWAPVHMIMAKAFADKHGIRSFEDIATKKPPLRIALNKKGNVGEYAAVTMLNAIGVQVGDIEKWGGSVYYAASQEQGDLMKDGRIDLFSSAMFTGAGFITEMEDAVAMVQLPTSEATIRKVSEVLGAPPYVMKAGAYKWHKQDANSVSLSALLVISEKMDDTTAYNLAKAMHQQLDKLRGVHATFATMPPQALVGEKVVPYHKGAERYYREAGLLK